MTREQTAAYCRAHGLTWREDSSNAASARGLIRSTILPALRQLHPAADANLLATLAQLRDEAEVLDAAVDAALRDERELLKRGAQGRGRRARGAAARAGAARDRSGSPTRRRRPRAALAAHADAIVALSRRPGTATLDLPGGLRAISEYGRVRIEPARATPEPMPQTLPIPGRVAFGDGELVCERGAFAIADGTLAADALAATLEVRAWRAGDRMRPLGLGGIEVAAGPVHGPQGPARGARTGCPWWSPTGRSRGCRAWRPASGFASDRKPGPGFGWPGA